MIIHLFACTRLVTRSKQHEQTFFIRFTRKQPELTWCVSVLRAEPPHNSRLIAHRSIIHVQSSQKRKDICLLAGLLQTKGDRHPEERKLKFSRSRVCKIEVFLQWLTFYSWTLQQLSHLYNEEWLRDNEFWKCRLKGMTDLDKWAAAVAQWLWCLAADSKHASLIPAVMVAFR